MFERYSEKARRVIFFARYECSQYGSPKIETEHLLLGLLRENRSLRRWLPDAQPETVRQWIDADAPQRPRVSTSIDLPLSDESKNVLKAAADEADSFGHHTIGTDHLFLGLFGVKDCVAARLLQRAGGDVEKVRAAMPGKYETEESYLQPTALDKAIERVMRRRQRVGSRLVDKIEIHGSKHDAGYIRDVVSTIRSYNWYWHKTQWKARDIVINRADGKISFEMGLASDAEKFVVVKQGWKKDRCFICGWELYDSEDEHGQGYTNGRHWLCLECCERFIQKDFFSSSHSEMT
jgi:hypothetical protein